MLRRYPLLKIYTEAEIHEYHAAQQAAAAAANTSGENPPLEHIGSSSSTPKTAVEKQFFMLTTKTVLEEVVAIPIVAEAQTHQSLATKRMLSFEQSLSDEALLSATTETPPNLSPSHLPGAASESPSKEPNQNYSNKEV